MVRVTLFENHFKRGLCYLHMHVILEIKHQAKGNVLYFVHVNTHNTRYTKCNLNSEDEGSNKFVKLWKTKLHNR